MATGSKRSLQNLPGPLYFDASALVKLYLPEQDSDALNRAVAGRRDLVVSDLAVTEIVSSVSRRRREGSVEQEVVVRLYGELLGDLEEGVYRRGELVPETHREAERLLLSASNAPLRAADALHLALAIAAGAATLVTFDRRLADAAKAIGLAVAP